MDSLEPVQPVSALTHIRLRTLPMNFKLLFSAVLLTLACGYVFALTNLALSVGLTQAKVVEHYWGNETTQKKLQEEKQAEKLQAAGGAAAVAPAPAEEELSFDDLEKDSEPIMPVPSFKSLAAEGHFHLFGYTFLFFLCALILSFAELKPWLMNTLILAPFVASVFDIWSILLTRFFGPVFAWMLMAAGSTMGLSFGAIFVISLYQMWFMKGPELKKAAP